MAVAHQKYAVLFHRKQAYQINLQNRRISLDIDLRRAWISKNLTFACQVRAPNRLWRWKAQRRATIFRSPTSRSARIPPDERSDRRATARVFSEHRNCASLYSIGKGQGPGRDVAGALSAGARSADHGVAGIREFQLGRCRPCLRLPIRRRRSSIG